MSGTKADLINYRLERADMTLETARILIEGKDWFGAANRLYYAVYQAVSALMAQEDIRIKSHSGAKAMFELHFIKTGKVEPRWGKLYVRLSDARHESDYAAFSTFDQDDILPLLPQTQEFIDVIKRLINQ
ncbi:HEPN domain-containing protein [Spirosoma fluviale]|uniref:Uncharacterized protein, contains HEPN domain, UPF0332 family n=1 Tax=Spirosoma fluviale TaxID=1597977 RepID=A0A286GK87_9BACT|nr:HEPN domain-containing protein [Spirosoma fluviale]SOD95948.1 Uncharacterized protein, contains HEPN domain, UPF0332 family [Spirosoma fluviale]